MLFFHTYGAGPRAERHAASKHPSPRLALGAGPRRQPGANPPCHCSRHIVVRVLDRGLIPPASSFRRPWADANVPISSPPSRLPKPAPLPLWFRKSGRRKKKKPPYWREEEEESPNEPARADADASLRQTAKLAVSPNAPGPHPGDHGRSEWAHRPMPIASSRKIVFSSVRWPPALGAPATMLREPGAVSEPACLPLIEQVRWAAGRAAVI